MKCNMIDLYPTILTVTLNVNGLNTKIKWQKIPDWILFLKMTQLYTVYKKDTLNMCLKRANIQASVAVVNTR